MLKIKKLDPALPDPSRSYNTDSGLDLYSVSDAVIMPHQTITLSTGIAVELPESCEAVIRGRSGLAASSIWCHVGTVDNSYRGEIKVILHNLDPYNAYEVKRGDRIAQLVIQYLPRFAVFVVDDLSATGRGAAGFGSSGK